MASLCLATPNQTACLGQAFRNPWRIAAVVLGFIVWWPIGLAMLFLLKGPLLLDRLGAWPWQGERPWRATAATGNTAFDDYRDGVLRRLEEERRKLEEDRQAFGEFLDQLKRARDREEFDRFMAGRGQGATGA